METNQVYRGPERARGAGYSPAEDPRVLTTDTVTIDVAGVCKVLHNGYAPARGKAERPCRVIFNDVRVGWFDVRPAMWRQGATTHYQGAVFGRGGRYMTFRFSTLAGGSSAYTFGKLTLRYTNGVLSGVTASTDGDLSYSQNLVAQELRRRIPRDSSDFWSMMVPMIEASLLDPDQWCEKTR